MLSFRIDEVPVVNAGQCVCEETVCEPAGHREILVRVIAAVAGGSTGDLPIKVPDEFKHGSDERDDFRRGVFSRKEEIKAGAASHGTKVNNTAAEIRVIPQEGSPQMFDRVHFGGIHDRLAVRGCHPQIKGGDGRVSEAIDPRHVDPRLKQEMIDGEAGNFFEFQDLSSCKNFFDQAAAVL